MITRLDVSIVFKLCWSFVQLNFRFICDFRILNEKILLKSFVIICFFRFVKSRNSRRGQDFDVILACKEFITYPLFSLKLFFTHHARTPYKLQFYSVIIFGDIHRSEGKGALFTNEKNIPGKKG